MLEASLNSFLKTESQELLKAEPYERTEERTDFRNGFRDRDLNTKIGTITLHVLQHRNQPFHALIFDNYSHSEAALIAAMAEMVVNGVSTRKVSAVMETLCGTSFPNRRFRKSAENWTKRWILSGTNHWLETIRFYVWMSPISR